MRPPITDGLAELNYGDVLRHLRSGSNISQAKVAQALGVTAGYLSDVERGNRPPLTASRHQRLAPLFGAASCEMLDKLAQMSLGFVRLAIDDVPETKRILAQRLHSKWLQISDDTAREIMHLL